MKDKKLLFDRKGHVLYSKPCKKEILAKIALHYPEAKRETVSSLKARLDGMYTDVDMGNLKSMAWFVCRKAG